eukprot:COSAG05_NODE_1501_length_4698_cov_16.884540_3_plen_69_part_00
MTQVDLAAFAPALKLFVTKHLEDKEAERAKPKGQKKPATGFIKFRCVGAPTHARARTLEVAYIADARI